MFINFLVEGKIPQNIKLNGFAMLQSRSGMVIAHEVNDNFLFNKKYLVREIGYFRQSLI